MSHETAVRSAFQNLLAETAKSLKWTLVPELSMKVKGKLIRPDGTLRDDEWLLPRGFWEAKDSADSLDPFCKAIESASRTIDNFAEKQHFLNTVYGVLHQPAYREKFADNLKLEPPRIPYLADFRAFAKAGERLADLHVNYEQVEPWPLTWIHEKGTPVSFHVEKMKLSKDKATLIVNETLSLGGRIPPEVFQYRLGNRSALEWVIDQYQVSTD